MKISVSTLGCPTWTLDEILARCAQYGYDAIELRGIGPDLDLTKSADFATPAALKSTRRRIEDAGLSVSALDSSAKVSDSATAENRDEAKGNIDIAAALGAPFVRVFGGAILDGVDRAAAVGRAVENLVYLGDYGAAHGPVTVVLETHDAFSTGAQVLEVLKSIHHPNVGALWDLHHPYRNGELPTETANLLGPYVRFTHVKDSRPGGTYCLLGDGDVPIPDCLNLLRGQGYAGYVSVEWEKRWIPELDEPEIVFPQYATKLREYLAAMG